MSVRFLFALAALSFGAGCVLVLDLDAEGGGALTGGAAPGGSSSDGGTSAEGAGGAETGAGPEGGGGGSTCMEEGYATFDGEADFFQLDADGEDGLAFQNDFAVGARVRVNLAAASEDQHVGVVLSRINNASQAGYSLYVFEQGGQVFPAFSAYVDGALCSCAGTAPLTEAWTEIAGTYKKGGGPEDLKLYVDGTRVCVEDCGDDNLTSFQSDAAIGSAVNGNGFFYAGDLDYVFAKKKADMVAVPAGCGGDTILLLTFDQGEDQVFAPECGSDISVTFGASSAEDTSDPTIATCP